MNTKKFLLGVVCFFMVFILTGCGNKTAITTNDFKTIAENHNYTITDVTNQYTTYGYIKEATIVQNSDAWQVEFYVLDDKTYATSMFNTNKTTFESYKNNSSSEVSSSMGNYSSYSLTSGGYYMHLCRVDNTLLYARVSDNYKSDVKELIKELGY